MQTIKHESENINSIFTEFDNIYAYTSEAKRQLVNPKVDESFKELFELFGQQGYEFSVEYVKKPSIPLKLPRKRNKAMIVCFSGGKDSIAVVKRFQELGYKVYLYHMRGINQTYHDEYVNAKKAAEFLGLPIYFDKVKLSGNHEYIEHPMKNMIIANGDLQYGIREGIGTEIAFGNYTTSTLSDDRFDICGGDDTETWEVYERIIQNFIPGFEVHRIIENLNDTLTAFIQHPELIPHAQSCIGPYRYKQYLRVNNEKKYGIKLLDTHCGSCWKCCVEYCVFCDKGIFDYNEGYYKHCLEVLKRTLRQETGTKHSIEDVWHHYFFYSMSDSKYFNRI